MKFVTIDALGCFVRFTVAARRQWRTAAVVAAAVLGVAACATGPGRVSKDDPAEAKAAAVTKRVQERWDALLKGDVKAAYAYLSPASRAVTSLERYQARTNPAHFRAVKIDKVSCEAETCSVKLWLTFDHRLMKGVQTPLEETWVIDGGQLWYVHRE